MKNLAYKNFTFEDSLVNYVNDNDVDVVSISKNVSMSGGFTLFYRSEKKPWQL